MIDLQQFGRDHAADDAHGRAVPAKPFNGDQASSDTQPEAVAVEEREGGVGHSACDTQSGRADPADALLLILADSLDDVERIRIASANRLRALLDDKHLDGTQAAVELEMTVLGLQQIEERQTKALERAMKAHPLGPWVQRTTGVGLKQAARLLAAIGDPVWNGAEGRPRRGPAQLWAYCGYAPGQRLQKGTKANWNGAAKMRARLVAESCIKQASSPYRPVYDRARESWADRDTTDLHKHHHALRCVAKAVLRDLFVEARALDQKPCDAHPGGVER
jgi:hypothetical protein